MIAIGSVAMTARGRPVDQRADIWAFGCVLFEMLTGRTAFGGDSATDILARVIERQPDWAALPGLRRDGRLPHERPRSRLGPR